MGEANKEGGEDVAKVPIMKKPEELEEHVNKAIQEKALKDIWEMRHVRVKSLTDQTFEFSYGEDALGYFTFLPSPLQEDEGYVLFSLYLGNGKTREVRAGFDFRSCYRDLKSGLQIWQSYLGIWQAFPLKYQDRTYLDFDRQWKTIPNPLNLVGREMGASHIIESSNTLLFRTPILSFNVLLDSEEVWFPNSMKSLTKDELDEAQSYLKRSLRCWEKHKG